LASETLPPLTTPHRQGAQAYRAPIIGLLIVVFWIACAAALPRLLSAPGERSAMFVTIFLGIFIEALPFLLVGVLASALIHLFVSAAWIQRLSPRSPVLASLSGALLGLCFLPVCECGAVPTARRLLAKGAHPSLSIAFVLAAPAVNPIVIAATWVAFHGDPLFVVGRLGLTILIAMSVGLMLGSHPQPERLLAPLVRTGSHEHVHQGSRVTALAQQACVEFFDMGRYLAIGALLAAAFQTMVPRDMILTLGGGVVVSALTLMALALVLSICSTVDAFVALAFASSFPPGAILAFLVFGPMVDIKSVLMFDTTFRRQVVALIVLLTAQMTLLSAVVINAFYV
jgi:uncharacterized membrane protein YraQ (UPF0718 family)